MNDTSTANPQAPEAQRLLAIVRQVSAELGGTGLEAGLDSDLERHLGLGSLERVEVITRLEAAFGVALPDSAIREARTPRQLLATLASGTSGSLLAASEAHSLATETPGGPAPVPPEHSVRTILEVLRYRAEQDGNRPHLHLLDDRLQPTTYSARDLLQKALKLAAHLTQHGIHPGDRVALILPSGEDFFVGFLGIQAAAGVPVPIYPPLRLDQLAPYLHRHAPILANAGARAIVTDAQLRPVAGMLRDQVPSILHITTAFPESTEGVFTPLGPGPEDLGLIQYTSGSTGEPKGVSLRHRNLLANMRANGQGIRLGPEDVCVSWLPLYHDMGLIGSWLTAMLHGVPLVLLSPLQFLSRPERWLWAIHRFRGSISPAPNFGYELCCRKIADPLIEGLDLSSWRVAMNGSEPVLAETLQRFTARFQPYGFRPGTMMPVYGMAENCVGLAFPPPGREPRIDCIDREVFGAQRRAVPCPDDGRPVLRLASVGKALELHRIRVVSSEEPTCPDLPERTEGRILFQGPSMMAGYFGRPEATEAVFVDGWIDSGDLGYQAEGELYITGRVKDLVIKGGRKYHPQDIERAAATVEGIRKGCVVAFAAPDPQRGEAIVVVAETQKPASQQQSLMAQVSAAVLEAAGTPADHVVLVPPGTIPKTSSGKLRRRETRQRYLERQLIRQGRPWLDLARLVLRSVVRRALGFVRKLGGWLYGIVATGLGVTVLLLGLLRLRFSGDPQAAWQSARRWARFFFTVTRLPLQREGTVPHQGPLILVANHGSYLDPLCLIACLERPAAILAKAEAFQWPVVGPGLRSLGAIPVQRSAGRESLDSLEQARVLLRQGGRLLLFPEGTFGPANGLRPFRLGAFQLAAEEGVPLQPVGIRGARQALRDESFLLRHGPIRIQFLPTQPPAPRDQLRLVAAQRDWIRQALSDSAEEPLLQIASSAPVLPS